MDDTIRRVLAEAYTQELKEIDIELKAIAQRRRDVEVRLFDLTSGCGHADIKITKVEVRGHSTYKWDVKHIQCNVCKTVVVAQPGTRAWNYPELYIRGEDFPEEYEE